MMENVAECFQGIIEDRDPLRFEKVIDGYSGFFFADKDCNPLVAMHWKHRFNHMVKRYNEIYRVQMTNIKPHVCRHTYCSNMEFVSSSIVGILNENPNPPAMLGRME